MSRPRRRSADVRGAVRRAVRRDPASGPDRSHRLGFLLDERASGPDEPPAPAPPDLEPPAPAAERAEPAEAASPPEPARVAPPPAPIRSAPPPRAEPMPWDGPPTIHRRGDRDEPHLSRPLRSPIASDVALAALLLVRKAWLRLLATPLALLRRG